MTVTVSLSDGRRVVADGSATGMTAAVPQGDVGRAGQKPGPVMLDLQPAVVGGRAETE